MTLSKNTMKLALTLCGAIGAGTSNAAFVQLTSSAQLTGSITTLNFDTSVVNGPGMSFEPGSSIVGTSFSTMHSGVQGLAEASPFTAGPDNEATFTAAVYQVGMYFGNDDTCCTAGFTATLSAFDALNNLIGQVGVVANMNDAADQFIGIHTDIQIARTSLSYGVASAALWGVVDDFSYGGTQLQAVPEPLSIALVGAGLLGLVSVRRRRCG